MGGPIVIERSAMKVDKPTASNQQRRMAIDNNLAENAIRPFVISRNARLFGNSQRRLRLDAE